MSRTPLPWVWLWVLTAQAVEAVDYCRICPEHTMCIYKGSGASRCRGLFSRDLTRDEVQAALHAHNSIRNKVAAGEERRGRFGQSQPPAANMHRLHWDEELATFARRWASQCVFDQDTCRTSADGTSVGQNIYMQVLPIGLAQHTTVSTAVAVRKWFDEVDEHDGRLSTAPYTYSVPTWHYTMLAWARTTRVGCGFADYVATAGLNVRLVVCNYKEGGNVVGTPMYSVGRPASQCGMGPMGPHAPAPPPLADTAVVDGMEFATTTAAAASWWRLYPSLPTADSRPFSKPPGKTQARGRRAVEATNAVAAVTRALPIARLEYEAHGAHGAHAVADTHDTGGSPHVYPALCP